LGQEQKKLAEPRLLMDVSSYRPMAALPEQKMVSYIFTL
jgi:hypothetical protein